MAQGLRPIWWMVVGSVLSAYVVATASASGRAVWMGMLAPLLVVTVSWVAMERMYRLNPARLNSVMMTAFAGKLVFFGAYVAVAIGVLRIDPVPLILSLTTYFIALHLFEAILLKRMFVSQQR